MSVCFLSAVSRNEALLQLVDALEQEGRLQDAPGFYRALLERERIMSTGIGQGVAVPHAKLPGALRFFVAVGIQSGEGLDWGALDGAPVRLILLIGGPGDQPVEYLQLLSGLTWVAKSDAQRARLFSAKGAAEVLSLFKERSWT
jgi:PTS system nitrogen regulatory IIA component